MLQWILFIGGVMIEPCLEFYAVPSPSQFKVTDFEFFCVKFLECQFLQSLWLIWTMFGMRI